MISKHAAARPYTAVMAKTAMPSLGGVMGKAIDVAKAQQLTPEGKTRLGNLAWTGLQMAAVGVPLVTATAAGASALYEKMTAATRKAQAFKTMLTENPHLHDRDQILVQRYFNTLHNLNPQFAQDPTVAASFVNNMVMTGTNPSMPHRDIFAQALQLQRGGGSPQRGGDVATNLSNALMNVTKLVGDGKMESMKKEVQSQGQSLKTIRHFAIKMKQDARRAQAEHGHMGGELQRAYDLLQQHGIRP